MIRDSGLGLVPGRPGLALHLVCAWAPVPLAHIVTSLLPILFQNGLLPILFQNGRATGNEMCFAIVSQHLWCRVPTKTRLESISVIKKFKPHVCIIALRFKVSVPNGAQWLGRRLLRGRRRIWYTTFVHVCERSLFAPLCQRSLFQPHFQFAFFGLFSS